MSEFALILGLLMVVAFASSCTVQVTGTSTGATCISFADCPSNCCTKTPTSCGGFPDGHCAGLDLGPCGSDPCCHWVTTPPASCHSESCGLLDPAICESCGCAAAGTCIKKTCAAQTDNNPDVCAGCSTCGGDWDINNDRGLTPWAITVTGETHITTGGHIVVSGYRLNTGSIRTKTHLLHVRPGTGGNIHVT